MKVILIILTIIITIVLTFLFTMTVFHACADDNTCSDTLNPSPSENLKEISIYPSVVSITIPLNNSSGSSSSIITVSKEILPASTPESHPTGTPTQVQNKFNSGSITPTPVLPDKIGVGEGG